MEGTGKNIQKTLTRMRLLDFSGSFDPCWNGDGFSPTPGVSFHMEGVVLAEHY